MVHKPVTAARLVLLLLCSTTGSVHAEEGTLLFDTEQGIDETQSKAVREMQELSRSLKGLDDNKNSDEAETDDAADTATEEIPAEEAEQSPPVKTTPVIAIPEETIPEAPVAEESSIVELPVSKQTDSDEMPPASEGTVLFDAEQGIDETQSQAAREMQRLSESLKDIDDSSQTEATEAGDTDVTITEEIPSEETEPSQPAEIAPIVVSPDDPVAEDPAPGEDLTTETTISKELDSDVIPPATEGTVLIDIEQGIDETQSPAIKEIQDLSKSLEGIDETEKNAEIKATDMQSVTDEKELLDEVEKMQSIETMPAIITPDKPESEIPMAETLTPEEQVPEEAETQITETPILEELDSDLLPPAPEGTVLIDTEQGIDEIQNPAIREIRGLPDSFGDMDVNVLPEQPKPVVTTPALAVPVTQTPKTPVAATAKSESTKKIQSSASTGPWLPEDSDLRILELRVESYRFDDVIDAYQYEDVVLLPLGLISSLLDISIDVTPDLAKGFIINENNTFVLDTKRNQVFLKGIQQQYDNELVKTLANDIYIESGLLGKWLGIDFNIDLFASRAWVNSKIKLPFLARIEREQRIKSTLARLNNVSEENYPRHHEPYKNSTVPFIDQTVQVGQRFSDAGNNTSFQYITHATTDLISHESSWYLAGDDQDVVRDFRVTFGRTDPDGELLGVLNANEYSFGHVAEPRVNLISIPGKMEPGVTVSNYPIGRQTEYDRHRFRGELLPGWEVEIYRNNALIGYQQTAVEGQYDFQDIPLLFGNNHFRLVFYGQKGEVREENIHFMLTQSLTQQGKHYYRASSTTDDIGSNRTSAQYDYGISKNLSSSFNLVSIPLPEGTEIVQHNYLKAGVTGFWDALFASIDMIDDSDGGSAINLDIQTRAGDTVFGFNDITLSKFFSEEYLPSSIEVTHSSRFSIDTAIPPFFLPRIPVTLGYKLDQFINGDERVELTNQLSTNARGFAISNQLISQKTTGQQALTNGIFQLSTNIKDIRMRGTISYDLKPVKELTNVALTIDPGQYDDYRLSFGINHSLQQNLTEYSVTANKLSGKYNLGFGARYNSNGEINLDLTFSVGFGYEPRRKQWEQEATALANSGSISARVFLDSDQDGLFGNNDTPLENVGFRVNGGYNKKRTDDDGIIFLTGITAHQPTNIVVAPETISDPLWTVALDGVRTVPRPGHAIQLDFPVFMSGEADGTVYLSKKGKLQGVARVTVELVDSVGQVINTTETSYDGFYVMSHIPVGKHWLRVSPKQLTELNLNIPADEGIEITADDPYVNGIDFTLKSN